MIKIAIATVFLFAVTAFVIAWLLNAGIITSVTMGLLLFFVLGVAITGIGIFIIWWGER